MTSTVGVIGSLYPVTTVGLAAIVLHERPRALQALGVAGVLVGIGLVTAWGGARPQAGERWPEQTRRIQRIAAPRASRGPSSTNARGVAP